MKINCRRPKYISLFAFGVLQLTSLNVVLASDTITIPVDSPAFVFSPGNWSGDDGRAGKLFRQTWNPGAYFRVSWQTGSSNPVAKIILDTSMYPPNFKAPQIAYAIDGVWNSKIPCTSEITIAGITGGGKHELNVYLIQSQQAERWGSPGKSGLSVLRLTGLQLDSDSRPIPATPGSKWVLIIGDSITEGIGASALAGYSHLLGQALRTQGYEYGISACGYSGWINKGDKPPGDVPGYYTITNSSEGVGGHYDEAASRWNKIDGNGHSLLDARGKISAYGQPGQEPSLILINYGTNDELHKSSRSDTLASMVQSLEALRKSGPNARIIVLIPFGQYYAAELKEAVEIHKKRHPADTSIAIVDLGRSAANTLAAKDGLMGGLHPNDLGHANFAAQIIPQVMMILNSH